MRTNYPDVESKVFATAVKVLDRTNVKNINLTELEKLCKNAVTTTGILTGTNPITNDFDVNVLNMTAAWASFNYMWDRSYDTTDVEGFAKISMALSKPYIKDEYYDYVPDIYTRDENVTIDEAVQFVKDFDETITTL
jgi:hypothetical protein